MPKPIIIVGNVHSGTTYLAECLTRAGVSMCWRSLNQFHECKDVVQMITGEMRRHAITHHELEAALVENRRPMATLELAVALGQYNLQRKGNKKPWGFKAPSAGIFIDAFRRAFPEAHWVLCLRNAPRAGRTRIQRGWLTGFPAEDRERVSIISYNRRTEWALSEAMPWIIWNYDGKQEDEQAKLREALGIEVDTVTEWKDTR